MRNPEKTSFNKEYFKDMSFPDFVSYWERHKFIGDPRKYYKTVTGGKLPRKKKENEDTTNN